MKHKVGEYIKIGADGEVFWAELMDIVSENRLVVRVDNFLIRHDIYHGLMNFNDIICVEKTYVGEEDERYIWEPVYSLSSRKVEIALGEFYLKKINVN